MKTYYPDKRALTVLKTAVLATGVLIIAVVRIYIDIYMLRLVLSIAAASAAMIVSFIYLPLSFSSLNYLSDKSEIKKSGGVLFRKSQTVKYASIQYATYVTTPFSGFTGLNFIVFYVYGGRLSLLFLSAGDADEILRCSGNPHFQEG